MTNDSAESARKAQDVDAPIHHQNEPKGTYHWGRGGEGNKMTVGGDGDGEKKPVRSKERTGSNSSTGGRRGSMNVLEKGKGMLGLGKSKEKEKEKNVEESAAVED